MRGATVTRGVRALAVYSAAAAFIGCADGDGADRPESAYKADADPPVEAEPPRMREADLDITEATEPDRDNPVDRAWYFRPDPAKRIDGASFTPVDPGERALGLYPLTPGTRRQYVVEGRRESDGARILVVREVHDVEAVPVVGGTAPRVRASRPDDGTAEVRDIEVPPDGSLRLALITNTQPGRDDEITRFDPSIPYLPSPLRPGVRAQNADGSRTVAYVGVETGATPLGDQSVWVVERGPGDVGVPDREEWLPGVGLIASRSRRPGVVVTRRLCAYRGPLGEFNTCP